MPNKLQQVSEFYQCNDHSLHVRHIFNGGGEPILMLHGSIENGRIFYTESGKGLAGFLAKNGFDVYVADYRGRGQSKPSVKEKNNHGYHAITTEDIPFLIAQIYQKTGKRCHVICHSWGGVMFASAYVRFPELHNKVRSVINFGTKRQVSVTGFEKLFKVNFFWAWLAPIISKKSGYLDAKKLKMGADSEPRQAILESVAWVKLGEWIDPVDKFDYRVAAESVDWPPVWNLTGINDSVLGHQQDVRLFMQECGLEKNQLSVLSKQAGNLKDYDHIDILTAPEAVNDHFLHVANWLREH